MPIRSTQLVLVVDPDVQVVASQMTTTHMFFVCRGARQQLQLFLVVE